MEKLRSSSAAASVNDDVYSEAKAQFEAGNYRVAEPLLEQMILKSLKRPELYWMLGTIASDKGQFNKAIKIFRRALEIDPGYTDASVSLSILLNDIGKYDEARVVYDDAQSRLNQKSTHDDPYWLEKISNKHEELADLYLQIKKPKEALDQLLKAIHLSTRKPELSVRIAETFLLISDLGRAIQTLKAVISDYPQFITARLKLGSIYFDYNRVVEAAEQFESVLLRDPGHPEALRRLKMCQAVGVTTLELDY